MLEHPFAQYCMFGTFFFLALFGFIFHLLPITHAVISLMKVLLLSKYENIIIIDAFMSVFLSCYL